MWAAIRAMKTQNRALLLIVFLLAVAALDWMLAAWVEANHGFSFVAVFTDLLFLELLMGGLVLHGIADEFQRDSDEQGASSHS